MEQQQSNPERLQVKLIEIKEFSEEIFQKVQNLLTQYTHNRSPFLKYTLCTIMNSNSGHFFFLVPENQANDDLTEVWGMVTVNICQTCSSPRAWVDDFVIDERYRHCGLGHIMMDQVLKFAHYLGVPSVMLTANPQRVAANEFCKNFGFEHFDTNVFIYKLPIGNKGV